MKQTPKLAYAEGFGVAEADLSRRRQSEEGTLNAAFDLRLSAPSSLLERGALNLVMAGIFRDRQPEGCIIPGSIRLRRGYFETFRASSGRTSGVNCDK